MSDTVFMPREVVDHLKKVRADIEWRYTVVSWGLMVLVIILSAMVGYALRHAYPPSWSYVAAFVQFFAVAVVGCYLGSMWGSLRAMDSTLKDVVISD